MEPADVSVVVPTYRRPEDLERCLASLAAQDVAGFEVLVADNGDEPAVQKLVTAHPAGAARALRYVAEPALGVHNARHAGARAAEGALLLFTDDDGECDAGWVRAYAKAFADPSVSAAGGPVRPRFDREPPEWIRALLADRDRFEPYALMDLELGAVRPVRGFFYSVKMAIRRDVLFRLGGFDPEAVGDMWVGDGETGLNRRLWAEGATVAYVPGAIVLHRVAGERLTLAYLRRWARTKQGPAEAYARLHPFAFRRRGLAALMLRTLAASGVAILRALLPPRRLDPPSVRRQVAAFVALGELAYYGRLLLRRSLWPLVMRQRWLDANG